MPRFSGGRSEPPSVSSAPAAATGGHAAAKDREPRFLTIREAAGVLRVSESTIRNAIGSGRLRAFRFGDRGGSIRIGRADLDDYMASCATGAPQVKTRSQSGGDLFKSLDGSRLLAAWRRQGVLGGPQDKRSSSQPSKDRVDPAP